MRDPYELLGVARTASQDEIKKAYRKLVKQLHPDLHPGDKQAEQRFRDVTAAYDLLGDADKRARFDRGEIDAEGKERIDPFARAHAGARTRARGARSGAHAGFSAADILDEVFGRGGFRPKGADVSYTLNVGFREAAGGTKKRLRLSDGRTIEVKVPAGTQDGAVLRLKGQGLQGLGGGAAGDALVEIRLEADALFTRHGNDVHLEAPVTVREAVLGASIEVPTIDGKVSLKVPKGSNSGTQLRLKGKGLRDSATGAHGDQYVRLVVALPDPADPDFTKFVEGWEPANEANPRKKAGF